jgi:hypothetical protein
VFLKEFSTEFEGKVKDIAEIPVELGPRAELHPVTKCVA